MPAPLAPVDHVQVLEREAELTRELVNPPSQLALGQRRELVEQRLDCLLSEARQRRERLTKCRVHDLQAKLDGDPDRQPPSKHFTHINSMSHGTKDLPAHSMIRRKAASTGSPMAANSAHVLT